MTHNDDGVSDIVVYRCSPFKTQVNPAFDASKVKVSGEGVKPTGVLASLPVSFTVDTREAGFAELDVNVKVCV